MVDSCIRVESKREKKFYEKKIFFFAKTYTYSYIYKFVDDYILDGLFPGT